MNIIIPMAGRGSRLRPHTLLTPKPLLPIAGKPIVKRLVEDISQTVGAELNQIAFIVGDFGLEVEEMLLGVAKEVGAEGLILHQNEPLGTAHAIYCAKEILKGPIVVAFADTLFRAKFELDLTSDAVIWVSKIKNPEAFGVVRLDSQGAIEGFVEKPKKFISDLAIIGIYYFKEGRILKNELEYILENNIKKGGEYQITDALENMQNNGLKLTSGKVDSWMDCGNKEAMIMTNTNVLEFEKDRVQHEPENLILQNSEIIEPCFIASNVTIINSTVGPNVSIYEDCKIDNCHIENSIIREKSTLKNLNLDYSMIGMNVTADSEYRSLDLGDFSRLQG